MNTDTQFISQTEFADLLGKDKSYVTRLKQSGRLVLTEDGKKVDVVASMQLIAATADPARQDVVERHAMERGRGEVAEPKSANDAKERMYLAQMEMERSRGEVAEQKSASYSDAKARKEMAQAELAEIELAVARKNLLDAHEVRLFASDLGATFRASLEALPDRLAHELVPLNDADEIRALLVDTFEQLLGDLSLKIGKMSNEQA